MIKTLQILEPRFYNARDFIFEQDEEVNEQIYITSGSYSVGFHLGKQKYFHTKLRNKTIVGAYENMHGKESSYYYRALNFV